MVVSYLLFTCILLAVSLAIAEAQVSTLWSWDEADSANEWDLFVKNYDCTASDECPTASIAWGLPEAAHTGTGGARLQLGSASAVSWYVQLQSPQVGTLQWWAQRKPVLGHLHHIILLQSIMQASKQAIGCFPQRQCGRDPDLVHIK
jgi:hypothetical protein